MNELSIDLEKNSNEKPFNQDDIFGDNETFTNTGNLTISESDIFGDDEEDTQEDMKEEDSQEDSQEDMGEDMKEEDMGEQDMGEDNESENIDGLLNQLDDMFEKEEDTNDDIKMKVESIQTAITEDDTTGVQKIIDDLYETVLNNEATIQEKNTKYDVLKTNYDNKIRELEELRFKLDETKSIPVSKDSDVVALNNIYDRAIEGDEASKTKVVQLIEDMYYKLTGDDVGTKVDLNEPIYNDFVDTPQPKEEEVLPFDPNNILDSLY